MATSLDTYMPYDAGPGSNVTEDGWRQFARHFRGDGVIRNIGGLFAPFGDSTGMQVKVPTGECWIRGQWGTSTSQKTMPIATAHATLQRLDLVILRNDFVNNRIEIDVLTGTAGSGLYPSLTQNTSKWEIQLAKVVVDAAVATIAAGKVIAIQDFTDGSCSYTVDSTLQVVSNNVNTMVDWDISNFDSSAVTRIGLNQFQLGRSGAWMATTGVAWASQSNTAQDSTSGSRLQWIARVVSGTPSGAFTPIAQGPPNVSGYWTEYSVSGWDRFAAGEVVAVVCKQTAGVNLVLQTDSKFQLYWLGP